MEDNKESLKGKVCIITGASSGLGNEFARQIDDTGKFDEIWVIARRKERLLRLSENLRTTVRILDLDLTLDEDYEEFRNYLEREKPDVRLLVSAAGFGKFGNYSEISIDDVKKMIDLNCKGATVVTQTVLPYMNGGARIIEICSTSAFQPVQYINVYAATKAYLLNYSRALGYELKDRDISVTAVCPYWIKDTEFLNIASEDVKGTVARYRFATLQKDVVTRALRDSSLRKKVSTPGAACTMHRIASKMVPDSLMMEMWEKLRKM